MSTQTAIARALSQIATESGEVTPDAQEFHEDLNELLLSEAQVAKEPTITDQVEEASKASDVTAQLDELADRADQVENIDNPAVAEVAVESLHREFQTIMRANKLPFNASSFESTMVTMAQAKGLASDARRVSGYSRQVTKDLLGYSEEAGSIMQFLRRDKDRLAAAQAVLSKAIPAVQRASERLKENPVHISHAGSARFLTVADKPALNFKAAVEAEAAQMHKLHDAVAQAASNLLNAAHGLVSNPQASVESLLPAGHFAHLNEFATGHHFMGNYTIIGTADKHSPVVEFRRINENKLQGWSAVKSIAWTPLATLGWAFTTGLALYIGGMVTGGLIPAVVAGTALGSAALKVGVVGRGIKSGVDNYNNHVNTTDVKSAAGAFDFLTALSELSTIGKMTALDFDGVKVAELLDMAHKAGAPKSTLAIFEDTLGNIGAAADCLYEQAIYDVVEGAKLAAQVTKHF